MAVESPVIGYRAWTLDTLDATRPALKSISGSERWQPGINTATCRRATHRAPQNDCTCGLYAFLESPDATIVGAIRAWGHVCVHETGFRAEYAEVVVMAYPQGPVTIAGDDVPTTLAADVGRRIAERLAAEYGCALAPRDQLTLVAAEFAQPVPASELPGARRPRRRRASSPRPSRSATARAKAPPASLPPRPAPAGAGGPAPALAPSLHPRTVVRIVASVVACAFAVRACVPLLHSLRTPAPSNTPSPHVATPPSQSTPRPSPTATPKPTAPATPAPPSDPLVGDWRGPGTDLFKGDTVILGSNPMRYDLSVEIRPADMSPGEQIGSYAYDFDAGQVSTPDRPCSGSVQLIRKVHHDYRLRETETSGQSDCTTPNIDTVTVTGNTLHWRQHAHLQNDVLGIVSATLHRSSAG